LISVKESHQRKRFSHREDLCSPTAHPCAGVEPRHPARGLLISQFDSEKKLESSLLKCEAEKAEQKAKKKRTPKRPSFCL
jgi:hypothetical protein